MEMKLDIGGTKMIENIGGLFALSTSKKFGWMKESEKENIRETQKAAAEAWLKFEKREKSNEDVL